MKQGSTGVGALLRNRLDAPRPPHLELVLGGRAVVGEVVVVVVGVGEVGEVVLPGRRLRYLPLHRLRRRRGDHVGSVDGLHLEGEGRGE